MCRISAMLGTGSRAELMHLLMLYGSAERYQTDGWGVTDGIKYAKREDPYYTNGVIPKDLTNVQTFLGHVRSASLDTELGKAAAHPYWFPINKGASDGVPYWFGVHNGYFEEVARYAVKGPNTDSYRAFSVLSDLIKRDGVTKDNMYDALCHGLFAEWMSFFREGSTIALSIHTGSSIIFFRNAHKPLYMSYSSSSHGEVHMVHTSMTALEGVANYADRYLDLTFTEPQLLPAQSLISLGSNNMMRSVTYTHAPVLIKRAKKVKHGK